MIKSLFIVVLLLFFSFSPAHGQAYDLSMPDLRWPLPVSLKEISGLCFADQDSWLLAIQDEKGIVFGIDPETGQIKKTWPLAGKGDFEGIEVADSVLFVLRSDGVLFQSLWLNGPNEEVTPIPILSRKGVDLEGLGWDPVLKKLLIAVKDDPLLTNNSIKGWLYYDPGTGILDSKVVGIDKEQFIAVARKQLNKSGKKRMMAWLKKTPDQFPLGPSAIAVHPETREVYMLSHRGKVLLVFNNGGFCTHIFALDPTMFPQPEGIAFNQKGDLFIASEGTKKKPGQISIFRNKLKNRQNVEPDGH